MDAISHKTKNIDLLYKCGIYIVFGLLIVIFSIISPKFYSISNIFNILQQAASMGIAVVGAVFVILTAGIDLSVGTTIYLSAVVTALLKFGILPTILISLLCGAAIGAINGLVISKWKVIPFIATLAMMNLGRGIGDAISGSNTEYLNASVTKVFTETRIFGIPLVIFVLIIVTGIGQFVLKKTAFGTQLYAVGNNIGSAERVGIKVRRKIFMVYLIAGILAGFSGLVASAQVGAVDPTFATGQEFVIISAAVLGGVSLFGGKGNILPGALVGLLMITCVQNGLVIINANPYFFTIVNGLVIFIAVMVDSLRNKNELR